MQLTLALLELPAPPATPGVQLDPEAEDQRRLCRERKVLTAETVLHVNRIKGYYSVRASADTSRCAAIGASGWKNSRLAMAVPCPRISKRKSNVNSIGSNCFSSKSRPWRASGTAAGGGKKRYASAGGDVARP